MKKAIDTVITDPATASAVESKTIKLGMSPDEVKKSLGNPDKIVDLGPKQVYIYKDMKVVFLTARCRTCSSEVVSRYRSITKSPCIYLTSQLLSFLVN